MSRAIKPRSQEKDSRVAVVAAGEVSLKISVPTRAVSVAGSDSSKVGFQCARKQGSVEVESQIRPQGGPSGMFSLDGGDRREEVFWRCKQKSLKI
jgi:hypothetical protein